MLNTTKAFNEGKTCYENGGSITNNPYAFTHEDHTAWAFGFSITERNAEEDADFIETEVVYGDSVFPERGAPISDNEPISEAAAWQLLIDECAIPAPVSIFEAIAMEPLLEEIDVSTVIDLVENDDYFIE